MLTRETIRRHMRPGGGGGGRLASLWIINTKFITRQQFGTSGIIIIVIIIIAILTRKKGKETLDPRSGGYDVITVHQQSEPGGY